MRATAGLSASLPGVLLQLLSLCLRCLLVHLQDVPCVNANLTQANFTDLVNPRPNGELRVLLKLPFDRVFCSSTDYRFLILGVWAERHHLELNQPQPFNGSAHPDAASRPSWRVVDVTEVSRIAEFDFLMDESHGLTKDTEYFVALSGCSSTQCRTAGFAKFTAWQQGGGKQNLVVIIAGSGAAVAVAACVIAVGVTLGIRFRKRRPKAEDTNALQSEYNYTVADRLSNSQNGRENLTSQHPSEADSGFRDSNAYEQPSPVEMTTFNGGRPRREPEHDEYIYDVLNEGQSGQTGQQPADENPYDEAEPDSQSTVQMQNFDAVPNSAYGASRACGGGRQAATGSAANSAYMYMGAEGPSNSGGTLEYQRWQNGTENRAYEASSQAELFSSKNDVDRLNGAVDPDDIGIQGLQD